MGSDGGTIGHFNSLQAFMRQVCVDKDYERRALAITQGISVVRIKDLVSLLLFRLFFPLINVHCYFELQYQEVKENEGIPQKTKKKKHGTVT